MTTFILRAMSGNGLVERLVRSIGWTAFGFLGMQAFRLASNLILTRLLFPEAFGLMALVSVFMIGLAMFSDIGIGPSIMQNKRGDEPTFLNTAWTIQAIRGACLWLATCVLAGPIAAFYEEPQLAQLLPAAGVSLLIAGFNSTKLEAANRHLVLGRVTALDLISQVAGLIVMIVLAWAMRSVWSLVIGIVVTAAVKLWLSHAFLPGVRNAFLMDRPSARELVHFGKWIFLSTVLGFLIAQGDKIIFGKFLELGMFGVYNIGYFLASFPILLGSAVMTRVLIPLYRERPPAASRDNFAKISGARYGLSASILLLLACMALVGPTLVNALYDPRFAAAGAVVVAVSCAHIPYVIGMTYEHAALAAGDSRNVFVVMALKSATQLSFLLIGLAWGGLAGGLAGQALALALVHPALILLARRHNAWDPRHDIVFSLAGLAVGALALTLNHESLAVLDTFHRP